MGLSNAQIVHRAGVLYVGGGWTRCGELWRVNSRLFSLRPEIDHTWAATDTPTYLHSLAEHNSQLLLVGGYECRTHELTCKIFELRDGKFIEKLPFMKQKRYSPSVASIGSALVVAGGGSASGRLSSVEVLKDGRWATAPSLPKIGDCLKSASLGSQFYLIQEYRAVFHVSLHSLVAIPGTDWKMLPKVLNRYSAASFFGSRLLSIGGERYRNPSTAVYALSCQSWEQVADLPLPLSHTSATVLQTGELIVVGGYDKKENSSSKIFCGLIKSMF